MAMKNKKADVKLDVLKSASTELKKKDKKGDTSKMKDAKAKK